MEVLFSISSTVLAVQLGLITVETVKNKRPRGHSTRLIVSFFLGLAALCCSLALRRLCGAQ